MKLIRTLTPEVRVLDASKGLVEYVASDETLDCYREIIRASGWKFTHFARNAPFVDSHNYGCIEKLVGRVVDFRISGRQLIERVQWAIDVPDNKLAQLGWQMTEKGYLKAVSVGFCPVKAASKWGDAAQFAEAVKELGIDAETTAKVGTIYLEQEQLELSSCIIGANPNALAKAHTDGAVKDEDLAALGFRDSDLDYLHLLARAFPELSPDAQRMADAALALIPFRTKQQPQPAPQADGSDAAREAQRQKRAALAREIKRITKI